MNKEPSAERPFRKERIRSKILGLAYDKASTENKRRDQQREYQRKRLILEKNR